MTWALTDVVVADRLTGSGALMSRMDFDDFKIRASLPTRSLDAAELVRALQGATVTAAIFWDRALGDHSLLALELGDGCHLGLGAHRGEEFVAPPDAYEHGTVAFAFGAACGDEWLAPREFCARLTGRRIESVRTFPADQLFAREVGFVLDTGESLVVAAQATVTYAAMDEDDEDDSFLVGLLGLEGPTGVV